MKKILRLIIIALPVLFIQCNESEKEIEDNGYYVNTNCKLIIESEQVFDSIPSGSGMALSGDSLFIISDDAPYIYQLSLTDSSVNKISIKGLSKSDYAEYRIDRSVKRDYEAATFGNVNGKQSLMIFGSGSKSPLRDSLIIRSNNVQSNFSLSKLYAIFQKQTSTPSEQWNIEGAGVTDDSLLLLNRGNNMVITIKLDDLIKQIFSYQASLPAISFYKIKMPFIAEREARLSGICSINDSLSIISASVEDTDDWTKDGPVLGSYICLFNTKKRSIVSKYLLCDEKGNPRQEKIESVEFVRINKDGNYQILAIADNDDGKTKMFKLVVTSL